VLTSAAAATGAAGVEAKEKTHSHAPRKHQDAPKEGLMRLPHPNPVNKKVHHCVLGILARGLLELSHGQRAHKLREALDELLLSLATSADLPLRG